MTSTSRRLALASAAVACLQPLASQSQNLDCMIQPSQVVQVGSPAPGVIQHIAVERGEMVTRGSRRAASGRFRPRFTLQRRPAGSAPPGLRNSRRTRKVLLAASITRSTVFTTAWCSLRLSNSGTTVPVAPSCTWPKAAAGTSTSTRSGSMAAMRSTGFWSTNSQGDM